MRIEEGTKLPCIVCKKPLEPVHFAHPRQPNDGLICTSFGNYGSTVFDPTGDHQRLRFNICDSCAEAGIKDGTIKYERVLKYEHRQWIEAVWPPPEEGP